MAANTIAAICFHPLCTEYISHDKATAYERHKQQIGQETDSPNGEEVANISQCVFQVASLTSTFSKMQQWCQVAWDDPPRPHRRVLGLL